MNKLLTLLLLTFSLGTAQAAAHVGAAKVDDTKTPQQNKMTSCNKDATGKKGDERKAFMKSCLSDGRTAQQTKMKTCNVDAAGKKGDERKKFMSECLKKSA